MDGRLKNCSAGERFIRQYFKPPDLTQNPWQWGEKHVHAVGSRFGGKWSADITPWVKPILEDANNDEVNEIWCMKAAQSALTQSIMVYLCHIIANNPGPAMWVTGTIDTATLFAKARLHETFKRCRPVREVMPTARTEHGLFQIYFDQMPFMVVGSQSEASLQSMPIEYLLLDEIRDYPPGALGMVLKRTRSFAESAKKIGISRPHLEGDDIHKAFLSGNQCRWHFPCPKCKKWQKLRFGNPKDPGGVRWDDNETTRVNNEWRWLELVATIRYECEHCQHPMKDTAETRQYFINAGKFIPDNPTAPPHIKSYHVNSLLSWWVSFEEIVREFLLAVQAKKYGDINPLMEFVNQTNGEPWREYEDDSPELQAVRGGFKKADEWADEAGRFMTIDLQKDHQWYTVFRWSKYGACRLMAEGRTISKDELRIIQKECNVIDKYVGVDSSWNTHEAYRWCAEFGWTAFKGEQLGGYWHLVDNHKKIRRIFSPVQYTDAYIGTKEQGRRRVPFIRFAEKECRDRLEWIRRAGHFGIASDTSDIFLLHMDAYAKIAVVGRYGQTVYEWRKVGKKGDHMLDCAKMQIVFAALARIIGADSPSEGIPEKPELADVAKTS